MNISNISNQIEIAFWMGMVSVLRNRRISRMMTWALVALLCLLALLLMAFSWAYISYPTRQHPPRAAAIQAAAYVGRPENGQKNLLLIVVDQLESIEPDLQGAWMLIYSPSGLKITFMPISLVDPETGKDMRQAFRLGEDGRLAKGYEQVLQTQGLWWDNHLVIDQATLAAVVELSGGIDLGGSRSNGPEIVDLMPIADQDIQTAYALQARIAQGVCQRFDMLLENAGPEKIIELLIGGGRSHAALTELHAVHTDITPDQLLASWNRMRRAGGISCELPTLKGR